MEEIRRDDKDKEMFRLWYECLIRTDLYWYAYHVYQLWRIGHERGIKINFIEEIKSIAPVSIARAASTDLTNGLKLMKDFVGDVFFFMSDHFGFLEAQDIGFDEAWKGTIKSGHSIGCSDTVSYTKDVIKDNIDDFINYEFKGQIHDNNLLTPLHNIDYMSPSDDEEWCILKDFDINHSQLGSFLEALPMFDDESMFINLSIYPFGKTKKIYSMLSGPRLLHSGLTR